MICVENCTCILCRELLGCEKNIVGTNCEKYPSSVNDNFILSAPQSVLKAINSFENKIKLRDTHFINKSDNFNNNNDEEANKCSDNVHKSVIYISGTLGGSKTNINNTENIDDSTTLASTETDDKNIINVIFRNSFNRAQQIINDVSCENECCNYLSDYDDDDFPLGMEADLLNKLQNKPRQRLSNNSRPDHGYQSTESPQEHKDKETKQQQQSSPRVNTPANLIQNSKPVLYSPTVQEIQNSNLNERMVSPKRKTDYFPHLYNVANNVKTSTFNENSNQNIKNVNINNNNDYANRYSGNHSNMVPERDTNTTSTVSVNAAVGSLRLPPGSKDEKNMNEDNTKMNSTRPHHHVSVHELRMQRGQQCNNSSSDDNRSSGHASMSDTGNSSPRDVTDGGLTAELQRSIRNRVNSQHAKFRHRATPAKLQVPWTGGGGLEDIKMAIQQLTMRSHTSTSTYSSVSAGSESSEPTVRRLMRHSSLETINTNVTSADEFVWIESHNRLVELQHLPWTHHCILRVLQSGRCRDHMPRVNVETIPRLSYLLQRALVRLGRETQRLSSTLGLCSKHEVTVAFRIILCPPLADSCIKACLRAAAMFAVSGDCTLRQNKSSRAGLQLHVGRFHRWMTDVKLGKFVHEYAAVYLCAGLENLLEEILLQCLPNDSDVTLTATLLEHAIANNGDLWGLLQPYAHLNAGRIASGALALPRWASVSSLGSSRDSGRGSGPPEPSLLTTCVGSLQELQDLVSRMQSRIPLCGRAIRTLFYFMRCSQLEHGEQTSGAVQELCYERAYVVLPPLVEWLRVAVAHGEHRHAAVLDRDDVMQAARLLLPGVDCPVRSLGEEAMRIRKSTGIEEDSIEATRQIQMELAFRLMASGRPELIQQAVPLLPTTSRLDTLNHQGHTALMLAAIQNDDFAIISLLDAGASVNIETPSSSSPQYPAVNVECQHWTALTYAAALGHATCARMLLERGANVEGGAALSEDKCTLTPLQVASGSGNFDMVQLLLAHGAHPFISTQLKDSLCYSGSAQRGCYSAISVAAAHGQRGILQKLLSQPMTPPSKEVLSLEEMLAEGAGTTVSHKNDCNAASNTTPHFSKAQIKALQEAMYHSAENNHLEITVEIRSMGVPWTLHCWMHTLSAAHEARLDCVIDQLLQDFLQVCPDDYSSQFVQECLPLLFNIFRYSKKEGTTLLLADIFSTCFGWEPIKPIRDCVLTGMTGSRIDPKYVNNPELSDVTFRVEGRLFYGHKIVLVTASPRLRAMLSSKLCEGGLPTVQINDIRYHIFQIVMQFLYQGGCQTLEPANEDVLELMAAANFFQLDGLLRYCEGRCAAMLTLDNVVSMYIHAKVYNAVQLLEYCQGFLLQNMVALLTYDDSVKRLLFAKKLPNHDVLAGLLLTLQNRIKTRRSQSNFKPSQTQTKIIK